jgi:hypothetical protein
VQSNDTPKPKIKSLDAEASNPRYSIWVWLLFGRGGGALNFNPKNPMTMKWFLMQCIKEGSTLRVSPKRDKPSPRIVFRHGKQDKEIKNFLAYRKLIKSTASKLSAI